MLSRKATFSLRALFCEKSVYRSSSSILICPKSSFSFFLKIVLIVLLSPSASDFPSFYCLNSWIVFFATISLWISYSILRILFSSIIYNRLFYSYRICTSLATGASPFPLTLTSDPSLTLLDLTEESWSNRGRLPSVVILLMSSYSFLRLLSFYIC